jgi:hypothetical protein
MVKQKNMFNAKPPSKSFLEHINIAVVFPGCPLNQVAFDALGKKWSEGHNGTKTLTPDTWAEMISDLKQNESFKEAILQDKPLVKQLSLSFTPKPTDTNKVGAYEVYDVIARVLAWHRPDVSSFGVVNDSSVSDQVARIGRCLQSHSADVSVLFCLVVLDSRHNRRSVASVYIHMNIKTIEVYNPYPPRVSVNPAEPPDPLVRFLTELKAVLTPDWKLFNAPAQGNGVYNQGLNGHRTSSHDVTNVQFAWNRFVVKKSYSNSFGPPEDRFSAFFVGVPYPFKFIFEVLQAQNPDQPLTAIVLNDPMDRPPSYPASVQPSTYSNGGWGRSGPGYSTWGSNPSAYPNGGFGGGHSTNSGSNPSWSSSSGWHTSTSSTSYDDNSKLEFHRLSDMRLAGIYLAKYVTQVRNVMAQTVDASRFDSLSNHLMSAVLTSSDSKLLQSTYNQCQQELFRLMTTDMKEFVPTNLWEHLLRDLQRDPLTLAIRNKQGELRDDHKRVELIVRAFEELIEMIPQQHRTAFGTKVQEIMTTTFLTPLSGIPEANNRYEFQPGVTNITAFISLTVKSDSLCIFAVAFLREAELLVRELGVSIVYRQMPRLNQLMFVSNLPAPQSPSTAKEVLNSCEDMLRRARELLNENIGLLPLANPFNALTGAPSFTPSASIPSTQPAPATSSPGAMYTSMLQQYQQLNTNATRLPTSYSSSPLGPTLNHQWLRPSGRSDRRPFQLPHYTPNPVTNRLQDVIVLLQNDLDSRDVERNILRQRMDGWVFPLNLEKVWGVEVTEDMKQYSLSDEDMRFLWGRSEFKQAYCNSVFTVLLMLSHNYNHRFSDQLIYRIFNSLVQFRAANDNAEDANELCELIHMVYDTFMLVMGQHIRPAIKDYIGRARLSCSEVGVTKSTYLVAKTRTEDMPSDFRLKHPNGPQKREVVDRYEIDVTKGPIGVFYTAWKKEIDYKPPVSKN